jgi:hypothetical protein
MTICKLILDSDLMQNIRTFPEETSHLGLQDGRHSSNVVKKATENGQISHIKSLFILHNSYKGKPLKIIVLSFFQLLLFTYLTRE